MCWSVTADFIFFWSWVIRGTSAARLKILQASYEAFQGEISDFFLPVSWLSGRNESHISRQSSANCGHVNNTRPRVFVEELTLGFMVYNIRFMACVCDQNKNKKSKAFPKRGTDLVGVRVKKGTSISVQLCQISALFLNDFHQQSTVLVQGNTHMNTQLRLCNHKRRLFHSFGT